MKYLLLAPLWLIGAACVTAFWVVPVYRALTS